MSKQKKPFYSGKRTVYFWNIKILTELIKRILEAKFDCFIIIEGRRGLGKSTLAYEIGKSLRNGRDINMRQKGEYTFNPPRDLVFSQMDFLKAVNHRWKSIVVADEMINVTFNRDFYSDSQKKIIKALNMNRDHCNLIISCVPQFAVLDNQIKNLCRLRITVVRRGLAIVHTPNQTIYTKDIWDTATNEKIERSWLIKGSKPRYTKLTTFRGVIRFKDLNEKHRTLYESIKVAKRNLILVEEETKALNESARENNEGWTRNMIQMLESGEFHTPEQFAKACISAGKKPSAVKTHINLLLSDEGSPKRFAGFFKKFKSDKYDAERSQDNEILLDEDNPDDKKMLERMSSRVPDILRDGNE